MPVCMPSRLLQRAAMLVLAMQPPRLCIRLRTLRLGMSSRRAERHGSKVARQDPHKHREQQAACSRHACQQRCRPMLQLQAHLISGTVLCPAALVWHLAVLLLGRCHLLL